MQRGCDLLILFFTSKVKRSQPRCTRQLLHSSYRGVEVQFHSVVRWTESKANVRMFYPLCSLRWNTLCLVLNRCKPISGLDNGRYCSLCVQRPINALDGCCSSSSFLAVSTPATGSPSGFNKPICTSTLAWSQ